MRWLACFCDGAERTVDRSWGSHASTLFLAAAQCAQSCDQRCLPRPTDGHGSSLYGGQAMVAPELATQHSMMFGQDALVDLKLSSP